MDRLATIVLHALPCPGQNQESPYRHVPPSACICRHVVMGINLQACATTCMHVLAYDHGSQPA